MQALDQDERTLSAYCAAEEKSKLPADLTSISLSANALSSTEGFIIVSYEFKNMKACTDEMKIKQPRYLATGYRIGT